MLPTLLVLTLIASPIVAIGSFMLTQRSPYWTVLGLLALEVCTPDIHAAHTTFTLEKIGLLAAVFAIIHHYWQDRQSAMPTIHKPLSQPLRTMIIALSALIAATALTALSAHYIGPVVRETAKAVEYLALLGISAYAAQRRRPPIFFASGLAALIAIVSLTALAEEYTGVHSVFLSGLHLVPRIAGVLEAPNQLAAYLGIGIPLLFTFEETKTNCWIGLALALALIAEFLTFSRGGIVSTAIVLGLLLTQTQARRKLPVFALAVGSAIGLMTACVLAGSGLGHMTGYSDEGATGGVGHRGQLWHAAFFFFQHSPLLGIGAGNFERLLPLAGVHGVQTHANSLYFQALAEGGIVLFCATFASVLLPLYLLTRARPATAFSLGTCAAGLGLALHQIVDTLVFYPKIGVLWWSIVGIA